MASFAVGGQSSGDFRETSGRVQLLHVVTRNSVGNLAADAFTQANPTEVTAANTVSTQLAGVSKTGVLGGSVAFTRPDAGNNYHGGPIANGSMTAGHLPLGIYLNDAIGNAFENTPGVASGKGPYVHGTGTCVGVTLYETQILIGGSAGDPLTYAVGDLVYASRNGLLTNVSADKAETGTATVMGIVKVAPDATSDLLVLDMRV